MPSQKQVHWAQLRVGITVVVASVALAVLVLLMNSSTGLFTKKLILRSYFENASGLKAGAPVQLQGVSIGNVQRILIVPDKSPTPVEVTMKVGVDYAALLREDSTATLSTAGVLGDTFVDINSETAKGPPIKTGDVLHTLETPALQDVIKSSQGTIDQLNVILKRVNDIAAAIQNQQGSVGKLIYDPTLLNKATQTIDTLQQIATAINNGQGSIGKLLVSDELYQKANGTVDRLNQVIDGIQRGEGTIGKLTKDATLYNNLNDTVSKANQLIDGVNAGHGALGLLARDQAFANRLNDTLTRLQTVTQRLEQGEGTAGRFLRDPAVYNDTDQLLTETRTFIQAIRQNPKKYLTIQLKIF